MAEASISVGQDQFMCPVCLDILKDPVTIPCGHSYCMDCIKGYWDQDDQKGVCSCPECRQTFSPRPPLGKNAILAEVVEKLKKTRLQAAAPPVLCDAEPGDVECDFCIGKKEKAVKSCLTCLVSYCQTHLQPHYEVTALQKHTLVKASTRLQDQICPRHNKLIELWCQIDEELVCYLCMVDEHTGHKIVTVAEERTEREKQLEEIQRKTQQRIQEREKEVQELRQAMESMKLSAEAAVEDSERIFTEMIRSIERRCREVTELIRDQEKSELSWNEGVLEQLEQEIADLRRRDTELEQISHIEDHLDFLQSFLSFCARPGSEDSLRITVSPHLSFEDVVKSVSQLKERLEDFCKEDFGRLSESRVGNTVIILPKTRKELLQYSCDLTLDPNTAHQRLCLSERNRVVTWRNTVRSYPDHPERFDGCCQVLCRESVSERCYWETEWSGDRGVSIAVSYKDIRRKGRGNECGFGYNDQSWSLFCSPSNYSFRHNNKETKLPAVLDSSRIGVYVDHRAGTLSFYSGSFWDEMTFVCRIETTFTQPLYPGFWVRKGSEVSLSDLQEEVEEMLC